MDLMSRPFKRAANVLLLLVLALYVLTGYGITEYRIVESLTLGIVTKPLSFAVHSNLTIPFIFLLGIHILQHWRVLFRRKKP